MFELLFHEERADDTKNTVLNAGVGMLSNSKTAPLLSPTATCLAPAITLRIAEVEID